MYYWTTVDLQLLDKRLNILVLILLCSPTLHLSVMYGYFMRNCNFKEIIFRGNSLAETFMEVTVLSSSFSAMQVKVTFSSGAIIILLENFPLTYFVSSVWKGEKWRLVPLKNTKNNTRITCITQQKWSEGNNFQLIFQFSKQQQEKYYIVLLNDNVNI